MVNCEKNNQSIKQAGRQRVAVSSERKSFNISISNSIFYSGDNIHHYHYFLSLSYLRASEMTKVDARTSLSKCSTVSARISQNRSVEDISYG